jgi:hypothetical protein
MSKIITSPIKRWPGTVTLSDPLTYPQRFAYEDSLEAARGLGETTIGRIHYALLPGVLACVEKWELTGMPAVIATETFPSTPKKSAAELLSWLVKEVATLFEESEDVPLA